MAIHNIKQKNATFSKQSFDHEFPLEYIDHLKRFRPRTMWIAWFAKWLAWETDNILWLPKTTLIKNAMQLWIEWQKNGKTLEQIYEEIPTLYAREDNPKGLLDAIEIQRKMRYFSEDYLNKEFDTFMSLLPSDIITAILNVTIGQIKELPACKRNYFGNCNDFEFSTKTAGIMQIDWLLYSHDAKMVVGVELKIDAEFVKSKITWHIEQIVKYCNLFDTLVQNKKINVTSFALIIIANKEYEVPDLFKESMELLKHPEYRAKLNRFDKQKAERIENILSKITVASITWQYFGEMFELLTPTGEEDNVLIEMYYKVVYWFLFSLSKKISKKTGKPIYIPTPWYFDFLNMQ